MIFILIQCLKSAYRFPYKFKAEIGYVDGVVHTAFHTKDCLQKVQILLSFSEVLTIAVNYTKMVLNS